MYLSSDGPGPVAGERVPERASSQDCRRRDDVVCKGSALCLSGGGIRSSSFCFGVLQGLAGAQDDPHRANTRVLDTFEYLSTVSGGGYVGGWLTCRLYGPSAKTDATATRVVREGEAELREHVPYLAMRRSEAWTLASTFVRNLILNWLTLVPLVLSVVSLILAVPIGRRWWPAGGLFAFLVGAWFLDYWRPGRTGTATGKLFRWAAFASVLIFLVTYGPVLLICAGGRAAAALAGAGALTALAPMVSPALAGIRQVRQHLEALLTVGAVLFHVMLTVVAAWGVQAWATWAVAPQCPSSLTFLSIAAVTLAVGLVFSLLNPDAVSLHDLYRDRLGRAFLRDDRDATFGKIAERMCPDGGAHQRPLRPVVNATANRDDDSGGGKNLERRGHHFYFSTDGWACVIPPKVPEKPLPSSASVRLDTAIAVSGAAVSPRMGHFTSGLLALPLSLLNARLGIWWDLDPKADRSLGSRLRKLAHGVRNRLSEAVPALEPASSLYLTDGGHFDNLGLYEMVNRGCRHIIVVDGGQDEKRTFSDLGNALRRVRSDFGVRITINGLKRGRSVYRGTIRYPRRGPEESPRDEGTLIYIKPECVGGEPADVEESPRDEGTLIYIKPECVGGEPADVLAYHRQHPAFPHESTTDQFFRESQFDSYRALGQFIIESALRQYRNWKGPTAVQPRNACDLVKQLSEAAYAARRALPIPELAGGILYRHRAEDRPFFSILLVDSVDRRSWVLPKGYVEDGETLEEAAAREVREETGYRVTPENATEPITAEFEREGRRLRVAYFPFEVTEEMFKEWEGEDKGHPEERRRHRWLSEREVRSLGIVPRDLVAPVAVAFDRLTLKWLQGDQPQNARAGGILWKGVEQGIEILLVDSTDGQTLVLPKGHIKEVELPGEAAAREVFEEAGYRVRREDAAEVVDASFSHDGNVVRVVYYLFDASMARRYPEPGQRASHWMRPANIMARANVPKEVKEAVVEAANRIGHIGEARSCGTPA